MVLIAFDLINEASGIGLGSLQQHCPWYKRSLNTERVSFVRVGELHRYLVATAYNLARLARLTRMPTLA
jgi:hypothetical protein